MESNIYADITIWLFFCVIGSFNIIGLVEGTKSTIEALKTKNHLAWAAPVSLALSFGVAYLFRLGFGVSRVFGSDLNSTLFGAITIFSIGELFGYNIVVKWLFSVADAGIEGFKSKLLAEKKDQTDTIYMAGVETTEK